MDIATEKHAFFELNGYATVDVNKKRAGFPLVST